MGKIALKKVLIKKTHCKIVCYLHHNNGFKCCYPPSPTLHKKKPFGNREGEEETTTSCIVQDISLGTELNRFTESIITQTILILHLKILLFSTKLKILNFILGGLDIKYKWCYPMFIYKFGKLILFSLLETLFNTMF